MDMFTASQIPIAIAIVVINANMGVETQSAVLVVLTLFSSGPPPTISAVIGFQPMGVWTLLNLSTALLAGPILNQSTNGLAASKHVHAQHLRVVLGVSVADLASIGNLDAEGVLPVEMMIHLEKRAQVALRCDSCGTTWIIMST